MNDTRQVGSYFKEREKVKEIMERMLQPKFKWTREVKSKFEKSWKDYWQPMMNMKNAVRSKGKYSKYM